ncbi:uncharacterized protein F5147DRAFT_525492, partial [Suillus discolor]
NTTIWTAANDGYEVLNSDFLIHHGLIKSIGDVPLSLIQKVELKHGKLEDVDVQGAWVTPVIVDLHSHIGVGSMPELNDVLICYSTIAIRYHFLQVCSIDSLNTHDTSYELAIARGVTIVQFLPGSA